MDAGERGPQAPKLGHQGRRVTNSHVIHHDFGHRYALAALGRTDLRRPRHPRAGRGRVDRRPHIPRLRAWAGTIIPTPNMPTCCCGCTAPASRTPARCRSPISTCMAAASTWPPRCCTRSFRSNCLKRAACVGAIVGVIGLAVTWRLGRRVGGPLAGLAALLLLALCPTFYGHMFMNPKDAPFAVAMVILMLGLVRLAEEYPQPSPRTDPDRRSRRRPVDRLAHPRRPGAALCA